MRVGKGMTALKMLVSVCGMGLLTACTTEQAQPEAEILRPVKTVTVAAANSGPFREFTAVVDASQKVDLAFKVSGSIVELAVKAGDQVQEGQLIARLDDADFKVRLDEAQSNYDKASSDFERAKKLIMSKTISQADFDQLKAQYNSALAQLETAQNNVNYTKLNATFDGVIAQRYVENFQEINALSPVVALHDITNINFQVDVPESVIINVQPGAQPPKVTANFASIPNQEFDLTFKEISTQADEVTKTYQVVFTMPTPTTHTILPGMSARVRVARAEDASTSVANFYLPPHAVLKDAQGNYVYLVTSAEPGVGEIHRVNITIGDITNWGLEVYSGVAPGDKVVTAGMSKVSEGMRVKFNG